MKFRIDFWDSDIHYTRVYKEFNDYDAAMEWATENAAGIPDVNKVKD